MTVTHTSRLFSFPRTNIIEVLKRLSYQACGATFKMLAVCTMSVVVAIVTAT